MIFISQNNHIFLFTKFTDTFFYFYRIRFDLKTVDTCGVSNTCTLLVTFTNSPVCLSLPDLIFNERLDDLNLAKEAHNLSGQKATKIRFKTKIYFNSRINSQFTGIFKLYCHFSI